MGDDDLLRGALVAYYEITDSALQPPASGSTGSLIPLWIYDAFFLSSEERAQIVVATKISLAHESSTSDEATKQTANARLRFQLSAFHRDLNAPLPDDPLSFPMPLIFRWTVFGDDLPIALPRLEGSYSMSLSRPHDFARIYPSNQSLLRETLCPRKLPLSHAPAST